MKKKILLFTSSAFLCAGMIMSNNTGPITNMNGNRTGSQGSIANCSSGSGCHAANTPGTTDSIFFSNPSNGFGVSSWEPGHTYNVTLLVSTTNITLGRFGFQLSSVWDSAGVERQAGTFSALPANTALKDVGVGLKVLEHTFKHNLTAGTGFITVKWTAPNTDTIDTVKFYAIASAVNNDSQPGGDESNNALWTFTRYVTSVHALNANIKADIYPNPVADKLHIKIENADNGVYDIRVFDINGKAIVYQSATVNKSFQTSINTSAWASGIYHLQISKDGAQRTIKVVK